MNGEPPAPDVLIVGGGLAGLSAAWKLAASGKQVVLLEARRKLGGRASSFVDPETGEAIDHCQHVAMGCCSEFLGFMDALGLSHLLSVEEELYFIDDRGRHSTFRPNRWPAPLHLLPAFWGLKHLTLAEKWTIGHAVKRLARDDQQANRDFAAWLAANRQTPRMIAGFWQPVLVSALSEALDRIDVRHARKVFVDGFLTSRDGWRVHIPNVPLNVIYDRMQRVLEGLGVAFRMESRVAEIRGSLSLGNDGSALRSLQLTTGETLSARHIVLAVPCWQVAALLPAVWCDASEIRALKQIETAPITSVHLWYDRPITELPHCVLTGRVSQWLFRRSGEYEDRSATLYQVVISNSRELLDRPAADIAAIVERELREAFPSASEARLVRSKVITEKRAVFSPTPGIETLRPAQRTPWPGIVWCGDWTSTGWPSTMESAVRSGLLAAQEIIPDAQSIRDDGAHLPTH